MMNDLEFLRNLDNFFSEVEDVVDSWLEAHEDVIDEYPRQANLKDELAELSQQVKQRIQRLLI